MDGGKEKIMTHELKMRALLSRVVKSTNKTSSHHNLNVNNLTALILKRHEETIQNAAEAGQHRAFLFVYAIGTTYHNIPVHNYLFPDSHLMEKLSRMGIEPVFSRIQKFFHPFEVSHKFYQIVDGRKISIKELDLSPDQIHLFTRDGQLGVGSDIDPEIASPENADKVSYIGCIVVSWKKHLDPVDEDQTDTDVDEVDA